jgi:hypothetical protein
MATQLQDIIAAARNRHQAFHKSRVPDVVVASHLSDAQRILITRGADLDSNRVAVQCSIAFATTPGNTPATVGAGSGGGLPAVDVDPPPLVGAPIAFPGQDTGLAIVVDLANAQVLVSETVVAAATPTTATLAGAPVWILNQFANQIAVVVAGTGYGQIRTILSNTVGGQITISTGADGQQWATTLDATSVVKIVQATLAADESVSLVTELPPTQTRQGYLIKLDVNGKPFIDLTAPLISTIDAGIPLPPYERVLGGSCRFKSGTPLSPLSASLSIRPYRGRYLWGPTYTCWLENEQLFLAGTMQDWADLVSIDLRLVPVPDDFKARTDYMLLPDLAKPVMIAEAAWFMAMRCQGLEGCPPVPLTSFETERTAANDHFLQAIGATPRAQATYVREVW